jgi:hypothetical protein
MPGEASVRRIAPTELEQRRRQATLIDPNNITVSRFRS